MVTLKRGMKPGPSTPVNDVPAGGWRGPALWWRARMRLRALWRRWGWALPTALLVGALCALAGLMNHEVRKQIEAGRQADPTMVPVMSVQGQMGVAAPGQSSARSEDGDRARLQAFFKGLPDHQDIPLVLQDLLTLAQTEGVVLAKGEYQVQIDQTAGFARFHMTMPVRGPGAVVRRFVGEALRTHPYLALDRVQLRRERADAVNVEAKIQWMLLTRLPEGRP